MFRPLDTPTSPSDSPAEPARLEALEREIEELAAQISAATCRWLLMIADFEARTGHVHAGYTTCATWLAWRCSLTGRAAREQVRVARDLTRLPEIREAFAAGQLSYSKARALTRVADPDTERDLLEIATHASAAQLERVVAGYRAATSDPSQLVAERRSLSTSWEEDGSLTVRGSLPPEEGALFLRALAQCRERLAEPESDGPRPTNADGLLAMAETALAAADVELLSGGERNQVVVHVELTDLKDTRGAGTAAQLEDGPLLPTNTARRLACDASIVSLIERSGEPISVGRRTRSISPAIARALRARDRCCRFPGCENDRFVDAHHIEHWADGGETSLDNLVRLCRRHHRLVHEGGFGIERTQDGQLLFRRPGGAPMREPGTATGLAPLHLITELPDRRPEPAGDPLDLDHTVFVLAASEERGLRSRS